VDIFETIYQRQSVGKVRPEALPRELIEKLLGAAVQAPNHHRVRPWRFYVLQGQARQRLGEVLAQTKKQETPDAPEAVLDVERAKPLRAPVVIAVAVDLPAEAKVIEIENVCAASAAIQNLLLAAQALGLGCMWRTGPPAYDPAVKAFLGLQPEQHLIGFLYLGYPQGERILPERPSFEDRTTWLDE
jgi:nitroreductase